MTIRDDLVAEASRLRAKYPQYDGYFDDWEVVMVKRNLRSRGKPIASKGELVLMEPGSLTTPDDPDVIAGIRAPGMVTVFLPNHWLEGGCSTSVRARDVVAVAAPGDHDFERNEEARANR